jgi:short-subunit dehydrogenase
MSSLAGFQGSGYLSAYAASKAFNRILAESLWYEWKSKGVDVIACCAGATGTPNYFNTNPKPIGLLAPKVQRPEDVVEECLRKIGRTPSFVSGRSNKFASFLMRHIFSGKMAINIMGDTTKKMYGIND